jgi:exonuclease III
MDRMVSILTYNINGLPWAPEHTDPIGQWSGTCGAELLCFQEVFTTVRKTTLQTILESYGYTVYYPHDAIGESVVASGLAIALHKDSLWKVQTTRFTPFFQYNYWDCFANKGYYAICLMHTTGTTIRVLNTHMQSNWEIPYISGTFYTNHIRTKQLEEIVKEYGTSDILTLIVGDLNQEGIIHPRVQNLCCKPENRIITFPSTNTNVDHVSWLVGTGTLPVLKNIRSANEVSWSDHSPLLCKLAV